jgi:ATP synthase I chain
VTEEREADRELAYRVGLGTAGLATLVAAASAALGHPEEAAGALVGGAVTIANFLWLGWTARGALRRSAAGRLARALWVLGSAARFGVVGLVLGLAAAGGALGLVGLLLSLIALPVSLVAEGLRPAIGRA